MKRFGNELQKNAGKIAEKKAKTGDTSKETNKAIVALFWKRQASTDVWICTCGTTRKVKPKTGWTNLVTHVTTNHENWKEELEKSRALSGIEAHFAPDEKSKQIFGWLDFVVSEGCASVSSIGSHF
jgi:hypothetical protein